MTLSLKGLRVLRSSDVDENDWVQTPLDDHCTTVGPKGTRKKRRSGSQFSDIDDVVRRTS